MAAAWRELPAAVRTRPRAWPRAASAPSTLASASARGPSATPAARAWGSASARSIASACTCPAAARPIRRRVLMTVVPARVAGVREVIAVSPAGAGRPPARHPGGVPRRRRRRALSRRRRAGGRGAGLRHRARCRASTRSSGRGTSASRRRSGSVYGQVDIDSIAGPSEVLIVADGSADAGLVAADMLAQAEHDPLAAAVCVTPTAGSPSGVATALDGQLAALPRTALAARSLARFGAVVVTKSLADAVALANRLAPEHLELMVRSPRRWLPAIRHAGAVFVGAGRAGGVRRLPRRAEPRAAHRRHRALRVAARRVRLRQADQPDRGRAAHARTARARSRLACAPGGTRSPRAARSSAGSKP